jgi:hypothetical protein
VLAFALSLGGGIHKYHSSRTGGNCYSIRRKKRAGPAVASANDSA